MILTKTSPRKGLFDPSSTEPFKLSRSKVELFVNCPRCFYLDRKLGIGQPPGYPFTLNSAVDKLLKREFDQYREKRAPHPLMLAHGIDAVPYEHEKMEEWRDALRRGIRFYHNPTGLLLTGGVDDIWINSKNELIMVDYKATAKTARSRSMRTGKWAIKDKFPFMLGFLSKTDFLCRLFPTLFIVTVKRTVPIWLRGWILTSQ